MSCLFANNANTTIATNINSGVTSVTLAAGTGALFPNPTGGDYFMMTFKPAAPSVLNEIVKVTARTGDVCTIVRGQEGTAPAAWAAGDIAAALITKGSLGALLQSPPTGSGWFYIPGTTILVQYGSYGPIALGSAAGVPSPMHWGQATVNFPIAFPTAAAVVICTPTLSTDTTAATAVAVINSASHFQITCADTATGLFSSGFWVAIGT